MAFSRFAARLALRLAGLFALLTALAVVLAATDFVAVAVILAVLVVAQTMFVIHFVNRTNGELSRFFAAVRYDDFSQSFSIERLGGSFAELESALEQVMERFRDTRSEREVQRRYLETLVDHVPVAIIAVREDGHVSLLNNAARRLLESSGEHTLDDLERFGADFQRDIANARPGERTLTRIELDGVQRHLVISTTQITTASGAERLITLQDIQSELDTTELASWQDMVRVLSHEIGNSITPVASLARTADEMVVDLRAKLDDPEAAVELVSDIHDAVDTIARRSEGLMRFVSSYRQLTRMPPPQKREVFLDDYFSRLETLLSSEWKERGVTLHLGAPARGLTIDADESLLDQAIINIARNAADAASASDQPQVWIDARLSERGRPMIEIADNGDGLDEELAEKIFRPFFTTKAHGSGIGLPLARQVMAMHRGSLSARSRPGGGAVFQLRF